MSENSKATSSSQAPAAKFGGTGLTVAIVAAAVVTVIGLVLWGIQLSGGMIQTNMRNMDSWGHLYHHVHVFRRPVCRRSDY